MKPARSSEPIVQASIACYRKARREGSFSTRQVPLIAKRRHASAQANADPANPAVTVWIFVQILAGVHLRRSKTARRMAISVVIGRWSPAAAIAD